MAWFRLAPFTSTQAAYSLSCTAEAQVSDTNVATCRALLACENAHTWGCMSAAAQTKGIVRERCLTAS